MTKKLLSHVSLDIRNPEQVRKNLRAGTGLPGVTEQPWEPALWPSGPPTTTQPGHHFPKCFLTRPQ